MESRDGDGGRPPLMSMETASGPRFYRGLRALPLNLRLLAQIVKYLLRKKRYPLFLLDPARGGLLKTRRIRKTLGMTKIVKQGGHLYHALVLPRFPSGPYDRMVGNGGLNVAAAGTPWKRQIDTAILGITRKCAFACRHCYERDNLSADGNVHLDRWKAAVRELQDIGTSIIILSGGEPLLEFDTVLSLLTSADKERSEFHIHTSGHGATPEIAAALKRAGLTAVGVGLDDCDPGRNDALRGHSGAFEEAVEAVRAFRQAGLMTYLNTCLTKELVRAGDLARHLDLAKELGVAIVRVLEPRPFGGYFAERAEHLFSDADRAAVRDFFLEANASRKFKNHPLIAYPAYAESPERLGCVMGGLSLLYIDSLGNVEPCVYVPVSYGNIIEEDFGRIYARMRAAVPRPFHGRCPSLLLAERMRESTNGNPRPPYAYSNIREDWEAIMRSGTAAGFYSVRSPDSVRPAC